jgi:hypothetical protein
MRAPLMPNLRMDIYNDSNGIQTYAVWKTEEQYQAVTAFFKKLLGKNGIMPGDPGKPDLFLSNSGADGCVLELRSRVDQTADVNRFRASSPHERSDMRGDK